MHLFMDTAPSLQRETDWAARWSSHTLYQATDQLPMPL